jgi:hypothetical protein
MKAVQLLPLTILRRNFALLAKSENFHQLTRSVAELEHLSERICCDNCQQYDALSKICLQNGCNEYEDWELWMPKEKQ